MFSGCKFKPDSVKDEHVHDPEENECSSVTITTNRNEDDRTLRPFAVPRLLVSVRSSAEATTAIAGGADILDVKEPERGSLGMADVGTIREIAQSLRETGVDVPLSVALGELSDWTNATDDITLPQEVAFAKLGLSGMRDRHDWRGDWRRVRERINQSRGVPLRWVAVAYADVEIARAPLIDDVATAAIETGCAGLLIDTFAKTGRSLRDWVTASQLRQVSEQCHGSGLFLAIAGSLQLHDLRAFRGVNADIIAIRSAACENHDRKGGISAIKIAQFRDSIVRTSAP